MAMDQSETTTTASSDSSSAITNKIFCVALEDLYPCTRQVDPEIDGIEIGNILDQFRFTTIHNLSFFTVNI